jgi:hypothetical protein
MTSSKKCTELKANYVVAHYWPEGNGAIGCYAYFSEVQFDTVKDAQKFKNYVIGKSPMKDWKIFQVVETDL